MEDKGKRKLQTPAVISKGIQIPNWKKQKIKSLIYLSYHHTPGSTINITSADANQNPKLINQQNLPPVIVIDQLPINPIAKPIQQPLQLPPQQPEQQQLLQQPPQPSNLDLMAYAPIAKLDNFTDEENDTQSLVNKPQDFNAFKVEFLRYFSNNNSINCLVNTFTTMKQEETEAVTTYLGCFYRNLHQIQAIDANYFTAPQILNQFIYGLCSSILQHVCLLHPDTLQDTVTHARDFESAESEANHAQAVNLVINKSSELDSKLENLHNNAIIKKTLIVTKINHVHLHQPINILNSESSIKLHTVSTLTSLCTNDAAINLLTTSILSSNLSATATDNISTTTFINQSPAPLVNQDLVNKIWALDYLSLLVIPEDVSPSNQESTQKQQTLTSNIPPATVTNDKLLAAIFLFEIEELSSTPLFSGAALDKKPITAMYTDAKVDDQFIKLILDSGLAGSRQVDRAASAKIITANGATKTPISKIDDFPFEVNSIMTSIKVLVIEATQYQALVGNDWLFKVNAINNKFKVVTTPDATTLEYYQSIYTHCKQRFNIPDGIEVVKKSVYQYIENCINNYLFKNYNILEVRSNFYNNLAHFSQLGTEDFNKLNFNIIKYCEETYPVQSQYIIDFESETKTSNKGKHKLKQYSKTTPNTSILPKTTAKHLQTPEQGTKDFTSLRSLIRQQEPLQTSSNLLDFLAENQSEHSETAANEENNSEITEEESINSENKEDEMTAYIAKISEFNREDIETSLQEWLDQVTKAGDANGWNAARMLRTIPYFLKKTAEKWFKNLATLFNDWDAFKAAFLEQFTDNNTFITL
ncbi:hypothetical protein G9A89_020436 [Geosiphon pyriformis]|nr:hypothetical protein G9A89_020436 [Geosiphon pyriformis]